jgi:tRNA A-37 threonylcarbamoyl transferase component Bud32
MIKSTNIIQQGAEAIILHEGKNIIKDRVSKKYRHPILDKKIIKQRTKSESKILEKANKLIPCPCPENINEINKEKFPNKIKMPFIEGKKLSENLEQLDWRTICKVIGSQIAILHDNDIIHGDLTTSNMIWVEYYEKNSVSRKSNPNPLTINKKSIEEAELVQASKGTNSSEAKPSESKLYFIDFGLGFISKRIEDKAVDLHLIKQALEAKHFLIHKEAEKIILENYNSRDKTQVLEQLKKVEARGRYKH